jgi:hypothetical protein
MDTKTAEPVCAQINGGNKGNDIPQRTSAAGKDIPSGICAVLRVLLQGQLYAQELKRDVWDFALELPILCAIGLSINDLRWLTCMGYVKHAEELNTQQDDRRSFRSVSRLRFTQQTCFVLTPEGIELARQIVGTANTEFTGFESFDLARKLKASDNFRAVGNQNRAVLANAAYALSPHWDGERRELRLGGILVKQFKLPSPNQETILAAYEEEGWPPRIDDPLPQISGLNPKRRLHDTIKSLNRNQKSGGLRFMGDGSGEGVLWELTTKTPPIG